ncbi:hypothetical protein Goshw_012404, partial [Gossypium schwendimanii]|nr:hypothetical protein [Gossypium schwendimanii]
MGRDEISLIEEELVQLSVKSSLVIPSDKSALLCFIWTKKSYNLDSFRAQLKSIWKIKKKFDIEVEGQNLFLISFENEDDMEIIMEGRPWLFKRQLIIFDRLVEPIERRRFVLFFFPFWLKIGPCLLECDKKDLMHTIGLTFGGMIRLEVKEEFCRLRRVKECDAIPTDERDKAEDDYPYSLTLKVEPNQLGKESLKFGFSTK